MTSEITLHQWITNKASSMLMLPTVDITTDSNLHELGFDSQDCLILISDLEKEVGFDLPVTLVEDQKTIGNILKFIETMTTEKA